MSGKKDAPLDKELKNVEWGKFTFQQIFNHIEQGNRVKKEDQLPGTTPFVMSGRTNSGVVNYISNPISIFPANSITVDIFGNVFYRDYQFGAGDDTGVYWNDEIDYSPKCMLYFAIAMQKAVEGKFSFGNKLRSSQSFDIVFYLPVKKNEIDFNFIEHFIAELEAERIKELEAYLKAAGLTDYVLTEKERHALEKDESRKWKKFSFQSIFSHIEQGRRLKKDDQLPGNIPFVMSGVTNNGVVNYISNPVSFFPANSITVDIFGNTFYRDYQFGAGDDTGVYWNEEANYSKKVMLFFATAMQRAVAGKFSFGNKLRSSQSLDIEMYLPTVGGHVDYDYMETFISAVQKVVVRDVVLYSQEKMDALNQIVSEK